MNFLDPLRAFLVLLVLAAAGRTVLALLPPGAPGAHGTRELPATWAASHLLGIVLFALEIEIVGRLGLGPAWSSWWALLLPIAAVACVRIALLPGALVPRHAPRAPEPSWLATLLVLGAAVLSVAAWFSGAEARPGGLGLELARRFGGGSSSGVACVEAASALALLGLADHALRTARREPVARGLVLLWLAWLLFLERELLRGGDDVFALLALGGGAAASVAWTRRGDRRGLAAAAVAFAGCAWIAPAALPIPVALLVVLLVASPPPTLAVAGRWCGGALVVALLALTRAPVAFDVSAARAGALVAFLVPALALAASAFALRVIVLRKPDPRESIDTTRREALVIAGMLVSGALAGLGCAPEAWERFAAEVRYLPAALLPLLALVPLVVGLVGAPDERTLPRA